MNDRSSPAQADSGSARLRAARHARGLTQEDVAERAGLSVRGLAKIEAGAVRPRAATLRRLIDTVATDPDVAASLLRAFGFDVSADAADAPLGRDAEMDALVRRLCGEERCVAVVGPGGIGKTTLARAAAAQYAQRTGVPVSFLQFADLRETSHAIRTIAAACGASANDADRLARALRREERLFVLDTIEHVAGAADVAAAIVAAAPGVRMLLTSRVVPNVPGVAAQSIDGLDAPAAAALFRRSASRQRVRLLDDAESDALIAGICARLRGNPLAIEVAAARLDVTSLRALARALESSALFTARGRREERQGSAAASVAWSCAGLDTRGNAALDSLGAFAAPASVDAFAAVLGAEKPEALDAAGVLRDHHLAERASEADGARLRLFDVVREVIAEDPARAGAREARARRHSEYYLDLADRIDRRSSAEDEAELERVARMEIDEFRRALERAERSGDAEGVLRLAARLRYVWQTSSTLDEACGWIERNLPRAAEPGAGGVVEAEALLVLAAAATNRSDPERAAAYLDRAFACEIDEVRILALLHHERVRLSSHTGDVAQCERSVADAERFSRLAGSDHLTANAAVARGVFLARLRDDRRGAIAEFRRGLLLHRQTRCCMRGAILALVNLGAAYREEERCALALHHLDEACDLAAGLGSRYLRGLARVYRGQTHAQSGTYRAAVRDCAAGAADGVRNQTAFLFRDGVASATDALLALGDAPAAATALGVLAADTDDPDPLRTGERGLRMRAALGADAFDVAFDRGFFFSPSQRLTFLDELARG